jgi:hypothetical protein
MKTLKQIAEIAEKAVAARIAESERYAEARAALAAFEVYMDDFTADEFAPEVHELAEALRALIEPAAVEESVEEAIASWQENLYQRGTQDVLGGYPMARRNDGGQPWHQMYAEAYRQGCQMGIQLAWNSWEPETAPGVPSGSLEQLAADAREAIEECEASEESDSFDDVFDARDQAASVLRSLIAFVEGK